MLVLLQVLAAAYLLGYGILEGRLPMAQVGPNRECRGPGVVHIGALSPVPGVFQVGTTISALCFLYLFLKLFSKLFSEEAIFIENGILFHSSSARKNFVSLPALLFNVLGSVGLLHSLVVGWPGRHSQTMSLDHVRLVAPFFQGSDAQLLQPFFTGPSL